MGGNTRPQYNGGMNYIQYRIGAWEDTTVKSNSASDSVQVWIIINQGVVGAKRYGPTRVTLCKISTRARIDLDLNKKGTACCCVSFSCADMCGASMK